MPACHAGGHEFESRTHRRVHQDVNLGGLFVLCKNFQIFFSKTFVVSNFCCNFAAENKKMTTKR